MGRPVGEKIASGSGDFGSLAATATRSHTMSMSGIAPESAVGAGGHSMGTSSLSYCNTMFLDVMHSDGLLVSAKGLGIEHVILNLIQVLIHAY